MKRSPKLGLHMYVSGYVVQIRLRLRHPIFICVCIHIYECVATTQNVVTTQNVIKLQHFASISLLYKI